MVRVHFEPMVELFVRRGISLLRWTTNADQRSGARLEVIFPVSTTRMAGLKIADEEAKLRVALGDAFEVKFVL